MTRNQELDIILKFLYNNSQDNRSVSSSEIESDLTVKIPEIEDILSYLHDKKYITFHHLNGSYITLHGRLFYENTYFPYKNMPFQQENFKMLLDTIWTFIKTVGIIVNTAILTILAFLTYQGSFKNVGPTENQDKINLIISTDSLNQQKNNR